MKSSDVGGRRIPPQSPTYCTYLDYMHGMFKETSVLYCCNFDNILLANRNKTPALCSGALVFRVSAEACIPSRYLDPW